METSPNFIALIDSAVALAKEGFYAAEKTSQDFPAAMALISSKQARISLRIEFEPTPSVTCELIRDSDGELVGQVFQLTGRLADVH